MTEYPTGTITFLLTDLEGSTELWERYPDAMRSALARHDEIIEESVKANHGVIDRPRGEGDSRFAVFTRPEDGVRAAVEIQQRLASELTQLPFALKARIGMHTGTADMRMGDYYGSTVNRSARIRNLGHGGQTLLSQATAELVRDDLPEGLRLIDLGTHHLKGLSRGEKVYQLWIPGLLNQFPPLKSPDVIHNNLPIPQTGFIGRQRELSKLVDLLLQEDVRLATLTGTGGAGKTRLSLEVGKALLEHFPHGVFFVDLAPIDNPALVATTIAHSMGIREGGGRPPVENLKDYLADKKMLLIFDNFEQIIAAAPVVTDLLASAPKTKILTTSRIALQLQGEHEYPVSPMGMPEDEAPRTIEQILEFEAVKLFVQKAKAVQPGFDLTPENAASVIQICRRLDGLPLAIEIAAARIKMLPPQAILKRLDKSLRLLIGGAVDLPARHQTLRNAVDWSYNLLKPEEQNLFARLSVFVGGFSLESAESVCSLGDNWDIFSGVEALFNASLLRRVESVTGEPRFDMLQTIREYALEKLEATGKLADLRRVHANYYARKAEQMRFQLFKRESVTWHTHIDEEHDNFRAALSWGLENANDLSLVVQICVSIFWFWYRYGHFHEGRDWSERAMAGTQSMGASPLHAIALYVASMMAMWEGDLHTASERVKSAIQIMDGSGEDYILSQFRMGYGIILIHQGLYREAYSQLSQSAEMFDEMGDRFFKGTTLVHLSNAALGLGEFEEARKRLDQAMPIIDEIGDPWQIAFYLNNYGEVARAQGDYELARKYYQRTEAAFREADALGDHARLIHTFGYLALHSAEYEKAWELFHESLAKFRVLGNRRGIAECLLGLASVAAEQDQPHWAVPLLSAAEALLTGAGGTWWPADRVEFVRTLSRLKASLDKADFEMRWTEGRSMGMEEAISYAIEAAYRPTDPPK